MAAIVIMVMLSVAGIVVIVKERCTFVLFCSFFGGMGNNGGTGNLRFAKGGAYCEKKCRNAEDSHNGTNN